MTKKKIIVINGHSVENSFCEAIANEYAKSAKTKFTVKQINLHELKFDPIIRTNRSSKTRQELESDLKSVQEKIKLADHIVFVYPIWWGDMPALMKGFLDRAFTPGFAYDPKNKRLGLPRGLLGDKSVRAIITMGSPVKVYKYFFGKPATKLLKFSMRYCGITNFKAIHFGQIDSSSDKYREEILEKVRKIASYGQ